MLVATGATRGVGEQYDHNPVGVEHACLCTQVTNLPEQVKKMKNIGYF